MTIDWNKPVQTKDGRKARKVSDRGAERAPIIAVVRDANGVEWSSNWTISGSYWPGGDESELDLINVPEKHELWVNVWKGDCGNFFYSHHKTIAAADELAGSFGGDDVRVACLHREFEECEGLS